MIVRLTAEQVAANWGLIKEALMAAPPLAGELEGRYSRTLTQLMNGSYTVWFGYDEDDNLCGCMITSFWEDSLSGNRNLLLYLVYSFMHLSKRLKAEAYLALLKYAKAYGCSQIVGYTNGGPMEEMAKSLNGDLTYKFFTLPVGGV